MTVQTAAHRLDDIENTLAGFLRRLVSSKDNVKAKQEEFNGAADAARNLREEVMVGVADAAHADGWTANEVDKALARAVKAHFNNDADAKSAATFKAEIKNAAHPNVRGRIRTLIKFRDDLWDTEAQAYAAAPKDAKPDTPLKETFARRYHMLSSMLVASTKADGGVVFETTDDVLDWAGPLHPSRDAGKVQKRLNAAIETLEEVAKLAPNVQEIRDAIQYLAGVDIERAWDAARAKAAESEAAPNEPAPQTAPAGTLAAGAIDIDDVLAAPTKLAA